MEKRLTGDVKKAAYFEAYRDALAVLLRQFDAFCEQRGLRYFLFADTLKGALAYEDFIPGDKTLRIGMLYDQVERLEELARGIDGPIEGRIPWELRRGDGSQNLKPRMSMRIQGYMSEPLVVDGHECFDKDSLTMMVENPLIEITTFYDLPDDFLTLRNFVRRIDDRDAKLREIDRIHAGRATKRPWWRFVSRDRYAASLRKFARLYQGKGTKLCSALVPGRSKMARREILEDLQRVRFHGVDTWAPAEGNPWYRKPVLDETPEDLKVLQECALEIAREIHRVCKELGIGYFACGGTMLGYVRDGGFIPWDDDIDVGMLRADYERFLAEAPAVLDTKRFFLQTRQSDPEIPYLFSKVRMNGTRYITDYNKYRDYHKGICVDIFPFDEVPNEASAQRAFKSEVRALSKVHNLVANNQYDDEQIQDGGGAGPRLDRLYSRLRGRVKWLFYKRHSMEKTQAAYDAAATRFSHAEDKDSYRYVATFVPTYTMIRKDDLLPDQEVDFSGIRINVPARPEVFLAMQYGDFMKLPPLYQRAGHPLIDFGVDEDAGCAPAAGATGEAGEASAAGGAREADAADETGETLADAVQVGDARR